MNIIWDIIKLIVCAVWWRFHWFLMWRDLKSSSGRYSTSSIIGAISFVMIVFLAVWFFRLLGQLIYDIAYIW